MKPEVKVGQVYRDKDKRMEGRHLLVWRVDNSPAGYAECFSSTANGLQTSMRNHALRKFTLQSRFELIGDNDDSQIN